MSGLERRAKRLVPILQLAEKNLSAALFERAQPENPPTGASRAGNGRRFKEAKGLWLLKDIFQPNVDCNHRDSS